MRRIRLRDLSPLELNPRRITEDNLARLVECLKAHSRAVDPHSRTTRLACTVTINRQGNRIVGGEQRLKALAAMGQKTIHPDDVSWVDLVPESPEEIALNLALNSKDAQGRFRWPEVSSMVKDLRDRGFDLALTGFSEMTLGPLLGATWAEGPHAIGLTADQREVLEEACVTVWSQTDTVAGKQGLSEGGCAEHIARWFLEEDG